MSTSLLYHTWGIRGYTYVHTRYEKGRTIFRVEQEESSLCCSCCGNRNVKKRGTTERTFKATPVGNRPVSPGCRRARDTFWDIPVPKMIALGDSL